MGTPDEKDLERLRELNRKIREKGIRRTIAQVPTEPDGGIMEGILDTGLEGLKKVRDVLGWRDVGALASGAHRVERLIGLPVGVGATAAYEASPAGTVTKLGRMMGMPDPVDTWLPDVERTPEATRAFIEQARRGDVDAGMEAAQDVFGAGPGFWGAAEAAGAFIPTGGPALAGTRLMGAAPGITRAATKLAPSVMRPGVAAGVETGLTTLGKTLRVPWEAEEAVGRGAGALVRGGLGLGRRALGRGVTEAAEEVVGLGPSVAQEPWQMTREEFRKPKGLFSEGQQSATRTYIRTRTGANTPKELLTYYQDKYPELRGVTIGGLKSTKASGPLVNDGATRLVFDEGKFIPSETTIYLTKDADLVVARHEIEHLLDAIHTGPPKGQLFNRFDHEEFNASDYLHRAQVRDAIAEGRPVPAEVLRDYPDLAPTTPAASRMPIDGPPSGPPIKPTAEAAAFDAEPVVPVSMRNLNDLADMEEVVTHAVTPTVMRDVANLPGINKVIGRLNPSGVMKTNMMKAIVGRLNLRSQGETKATTVMHTVRAIGDEKKLFGPTNAEGRLTEGPLAGNLLHEIRTYPKRYADRLTETQQRWIDAMDEVEKIKLGVLQRAGITINLLKFDEGGRYAGRRVFAKQEPDGSIVDYQMANKKGVLQGRTPSEKTRQFKNIEDAIAEGYRYLPEEEALMLNLQSAYNRVADKQFVNWMLDNLDEGVTLAVDPTVTERMLTPSYIRKYIRKHGRRDFLKAHGDEGEAVLWDIAPERFKVETKDAKGKVTTAWKVFDGPEAEEARKALVSSLNPEFSKALDNINQVNAVSRFVALGGDASPFLIQLMFLSGADPVAYAKAMRGFVGALADPQFISRYMNKPEVQQFLKRRSPNYITTFQGTEVTEAGMKSGLLQHPLVQKGPAWLPHKVYINQYLGAFGRAFNAALDIAGVELGMVLESRALNPALAKKYGQTPAQRVAELDDYLNEIRGLADPRKLGVSNKWRQIEATALLAPRYGRSIVALLGDVIQGAAQIQSYPGVGRVARAMGKEVGERPLGKTYTELGGLRAELARNHMARSIGGLSFLAVGLTMAGYANAHWGEEDLLEKSFDAAVKKITPNSPEFFTWQLAGRNVGLGTKVRSIVRLFGKSITNPGMLSPEFWKGRDGQGWISNPALRFARGNLSPVGSDAVDLITGYDYIGDPTSIDFSVESAKNIGKNVLSEDLLPIWAHGLFLEGFEAGQWKPTTPRMAGAVVGFVGGREYPVLPTQIMQDLHRDDPEWRDMSYDELPARVLRRYEEEAEKRLGPKAPRRRGLKPPFGRDIRAESFTGIEAAKETFLGKVEQEVMTGLIPEPFQPGYAPKSAMDKYKKAKQDYQIKVRGVDREGGFAAEVYTDMEEPEEGAPERVTWEYYQLYEKAKDDKGEIDWDVFSELELDFWSNLTPNQVDYISEDIHVMEADMPQEVEDMLNAERYVYSMRLRMEPGQLPTTYFDLSDTDTVVNSVLRQLPAGQRGAVMRYKEATYEQKLDLRRSGDDLASAAAYTKINSALSNNETLKALQARFIAKAPGEWTATALLYGIPIKDATWRTRKYKSGLDKGTIPLPNISYREEWKNNLSRVR